MACHGFTQHVSAEVQITLERHKRIRRLAATIFASDSVLQDMPVKVRQRILNSIEVDTQMQTREITFSRGWKKHIRQQKIEVPDAYVEAYNASF